MARYLHHLAATFHLVDQLQALGAEAVHGNIYSLIVMGSFARMPQVGWPLPHACTQRYPEPYQIAHHPGHHGLDLVVRFPDQSPAPLIGDPVRSRSEAAQRPRGARRIHRQSRSSSPASSPTAQCRLLVMSTKTKGPYALIWPAMQNMDSARLTSKASFKVEERI
jgi:hypothetical protein